MTSKGKMIEMIYTANLTQRATLVIFYLINRADKEMTCFPSVGKIAKECNISSRTVQRALNDLEDYGFLERVSRFHERGGQRSNLYRLVKIDKMLVEKVGFEYCRSQTDDCKRSKRVYNSSEIEAEVPTSKFDLKFEKKYSRHWHLKTIKTLFFKLCHSAYDIFTSLEL